MLIALCFLLSCGGDDPLNIEPEPPQPEEPYVPEEPDPFKGYLVKNKEGFDVNSINILYYNEDSTFLTGFKNEKLWVALFNEHTNEQLHEWNGTEAFDRTIDIDLGYGKHDVFKTTGFSCDIVKDDFFNKSRLVKTSWGFVVPPHYLKENGEKVKKDVFLLNGENIFTYMTEKGPILHHYSWYQNSIVIDDFVVSPEGIDLVELNISNSLDEVIPISYTAGLYFQSNRDHEYPEDYVSIGCYSYTEGYSTDQPVWWKPIPSLRGLERDPQISIVVLEQKNTIWKMSVDVLNYSGSKRQSVFTVNVETGELTVLN